MAFLKKLVVIAASTSIIASCADKSADVTAAYVSPVQFERLNCRQISEEASRISTRAAQAAGVQDKNAQGDAVATGVALVLFWPAAFFIKGNKENRAELSRLKGELEALEQISTKKNCGIVFRKESAEEATEDLEE